MNNRIKMVTFSGVDGAGKTTILGRFVRFLQDEHNQDVIVLRHRPSVLPILSSIKHGKRLAEQKTKRNLPRTGSNRSKVSSILRFFYYLTDYVLGQWVVYFRYMRKNQIVVYDRYYFDFIVDPKRANLNTSKRFTGFFYRFIFKPDMNIFLYADPDVILSRKQELDRESIYELTNEYRSLFDSLAEGNSDQYLSIENTNIECTLEKIGNVYRKLSS